MMLGYSVSVPLSSASFHSLLRLRNPWREHLGFLLSACVITFTGSQFLQVFSFVSCCFRVSLPARLSLVARKAGKYHLTKTVCNISNRSLAGFISLRFHLSHRTPDLHLTRRLGALVLCQILKAGLKYAQISCGITLQQHKSWKNTLRSLGALPPTAQRRRDRAYHL